MDLQLTVHGTSLEQALAALGASVNDWSASWAQVGEELRRIVRKQFESQGARGTLGAWTPLTKAYAARKARTYPGKPLLRATDRLYDSLTGDSPDAVFEATSRQLSFGTSVPYAAFAAGREGERQSARPVFDLRESDGATLVAPLVRAGRAAARKLGFAE